MSFILYVLPTTLGALGLLPFGRISVVVSLVGMLPLNARALFHFEPTDSSFTSPSPPQSSKHSNNPQNTSTGLKGPQATHREGQITPNSKRARQCGQSEHPPTTNNHPTDTTTKKIF